MSPPQPSEIASIEPGKSRFYHVQDHLLTRAERWELACVGLPSDSRAEARRRGCTGAVVKPEARRFEHAGPDCHAAMNWLHDTFYEPAYREALSWGYTHGHYECEFGGTQLLAVGASGVFVAVQFSRLSGWRVYTALRVGGREANDESDNMAFFDRAVRKWRTRTSNPSGRST